MVLCFLDVLLTVYVYTGYASSPAPLLGVFHNTLINAIPEISEVRQLEYSGSEGVLAGRGTCS